MLTCKASSFFCTSLLEDLYVCVCGKADVRQCETSSLSVLVGRFHESAMGSWTKHSAFFFLVPVFIVEVMPPEFLTEVPKLFH